MTYPGISAGINSRTGEALILPKEPLSSWFSYNLASWLTMYLVYSLLLIIYTLPGWDNDLAESIIKVLSGVLLAMIPIIIIHELLFSFLYGVPGIASFVKKNGKFKKFLLGSSMGAAFCLLTVMIILLLMIVPSRGWV